MKWFHLHKWNFFFQKNHLYLVFSICSHEYVEGWLKICTPHLVYVYIARIG
jgi:hypothetical protein